MYLVLGLTWKVRANASANGNNPIAAIHGFKDQDAIRLDIIFRKVECIARSAKAPQSVGFEGELIYAGRALAK